MFGITAVEDFAPAKINLYLHVGPPDAAGYHPLDSLAAFADIGDSVGVIPADTLSLTVAGPFAAGLQNEPDNLVLRAARAVAAHAGIAPHAAIALEKNLPIASGIGGGSSDAAAALRALRTLWGLSVTDDELAKIAAGLGADVPACVASAPVRMRGRGERLERATLPDGIFLALANTGTPVPTGAVYRRFDEMGLGGGFAEAPPPDMSDPALFIAALKDRRNDLEAPAFALAPEVARLKAAMAAQPGCALARMSGSGGTIFGLFTDPDAARAAADRLQSQGDADWTASGRLHGENT